MLSDLADGTRDAVLIYHVDRLTRRPIEAHDALDVDLCGRPSASSGHPRRR